MVSIPDVPTYCEAELVALCSQKTDPIPVCYTLGGVSQTIYAVLKHPHKGAPTVAFMAADFTSFNATTGGTFAVGECKSPTLTPNPIHWIETQPAQTIAINPWEYSIDNGASWTVGANGYADRVPQVMGPAGQNRLRSAFVAPCDGLFVIDMRDDILGPPVTGPNLGAELLIDGITVLRPTQDELWSMYNTGSPVAVTVQVAAGTHAIEFLHAMYDTVGDTWTNTNSVQFTCNEICREGKAWYNSQTGALVKVTSLFGVTVPTPTVLIEGACPVIKPEKFSNPVHWCEAQAGIVGGTRESKGDWNWGNFGSPQSWRFYTVSQSTNATYVDANVINDWYVNTTLPTYTYTVPAPNLPGVFQNIVITRSEINSVSFQVNDSIEIIGLGAPTNINPNVDPSLAPNTTSWRFADVVADQAGVSICKEGKALYTRNANNQVTLDAVVSLGGKVQTVGAAGIKEGGCPITLERRAGCVSMQDGEKWNVQEVITACGDVKYFDADVSPAKDVTSLVATWLYAGPCDCCDEIVPSGPRPALTQRISYNNSSMAIAMCQDKFDPAVGLRWKVRVSKNNVIVYTSTLSPVFSSRASAKAWMNGVGGNGYFQFDNIAGGLTSNGGNGSFTYKMASTAEPDEWIVAIEETATGTGLSQLCGPLQFPMNWGYANKATLYGASQNDADAIMNNNNLVMAIGIGLNNFGWSHG